MPAKTLEPLSYTTPPFAAVSAVVGYDTSQMTNATLSPEPDPSKPSFKGPFWAMFAVGLLLAIIVGMSIAWWRKHKERLASGYYSELRPVSNYQEWRERKATKLLRPTVNSSGSQSRRDSESQQRASLMQGEPSSSSPASGRE